MVYAIVNAAATARATTTATASISMHSYIFTGNKQGCWDNSVFFNMPYSYPMQKSKIELFVFKDSNCSDSEQNSRVHISFVRKE